MKGGIENRDLRNARKQLLAGFHPPEIVRIVQRRKLDAVPDRVLDFIGHQCGAREFLTPVRDPVSDGVDFGLVRNDPVVSAEQGGNHSFDGLRMIGGLHPNSNPVAVQPLVVKQRTAHADSFDLSLGMTYVLHRIEKLVLDRGAA
jgi:hypothetical protein